MTGSQSIHVWPDDLERRAAMGQILQADFLHNTRTVLPRTTKFGTVAHGEGRISRGSTTSPP